ncbi:MAG TPA: sigma-54 factor interaction domain-containing protein, partial [Gemmatimonadaceae bacterium]|nr:sigma-54 factor interaction domain-containing protein [Gemmatimonadaceae bacterium]
MPLVSNNFIDSGNAEDIRERFLTTEVPRSALRILAVGSAQVPSSKSVITKLSKWSADSGVECVMAADLPVAVRVMIEQHCDIVFTVLGDRPLDELQWWMATLRGAPSPSHLIALIERPSIGIVLQAERLGVNDLLSLPLRREDFDRVVHRVQTASDEHTIPLPPVQPDLPGAAAMVGQHASMLDVYKLIARVAPNTATMLILGESGTGKEVVARAIHLNGPRASGPFIAVNCAAIPENLLESELFGHERGAFTGAVARRAGRFELAIGGTLFLDEIGDLSMALQAKILRVLQEHEIERLGGKETIPVDVRVIAATNQNLRAAIAERRFREDLFYRLAVVTINLPRLVDRGEDVLLLTAFFATHFARVSGKHIHTISDRALDVL